MLKKVFVFWVQILSLILGLHVSAQNPLEFPYSIKKYTVDDGLSGNSINQIVQDPQGYIWIATAGGLNRFDGHTFETIPLPIDSTTNSVDTYVSCVINVENHVYVQTKTTIYEWNFIKEKLDLVYKKTPPILTQHSRFINFGDSLVGIDYWEKKLHIYKNPYTKGRQIIPESVANFTESRDSLWVITQKEFIILSKDFKLTRRKHGIKLFTELDILFIKEKLDKTGFWIHRPINFDKPSLLISFDLASYKAQLVSQETSAGIKNLQTYSSEIFEDYKNRLWIGTSYDGFFIFDSKKNKLYNAKEIESLAPFFDQFLSRVVTLIDNQLWLAGNGTGILVVDLNPKKFNTIPVGTKIDKVEVSNLVKNVFVLDSTLWFLNHNEPFSLAKVDLKTWKGEVIQVYNGNERLQMSDVFTNDGIHFWIGSANRQVISLDRTSKPAKINLMEQFLPKVDFSGIMYGDTSGVLIGSRRGFQKLNTKDELLYAFSLNDSSANENFMWQMAGARDMVRNRDWISANEDLVYYDVKTKQTHKIVVPEFRENDIKHIEIIKRNDVLNQNLWITAENGLLYYEPDTQRKRFFDTRNGLPDNFIYGLVVDKKGDLWLPTNKGLSHASITLDNENLPILEFRNFSVRDGLQSNEFNSFGFSKAKDGSIWLAGVGGINYFNPDSIHDETRTPISIFKEMRVFNEPFKTDTAFSLKKCIKLGYNESDFTIFYTGIYFTRANELSYAYQMLGQDKDWIFAGSNNNARYLNLSPGLYRFKLKVANYDGVWSEPKSIWISIARPFWMETWFVLIALFLFSLAVFGLVRLLSIRKLKKILIELEKKELINKERTRIAQDLHDEIGANLTQIALLSELVQHEMTKTGSNSAPLKRVVDAAKVGVLNLSEIVWAINPKNDKLENVVSYLQEYAENYFKESSTRLHFDISDDFPKLFIPSDTRHALIMTVKEILNNALKYSKANQVWFFMAIEESVFILKIQDDGIGFDLAEALNKGNGLGHILSRLKPFNGICTIDTKEGEGCEITLKLHLGEKK